MILYPDCETVKTNSVLYSSHDAIRKLAIMMMVNTAETNVDMVMDCSNEYKTKEEIEAVFQGLNEVALEMLDDHIDDLRRSLEAALRDIKYTARVRRLDYDKDGSLSDVTVDISVE